MKREVRWTDFGVLVKKRLIDLDMTQKDLADALGTTKQYLQKIMRGERSGEKYVEKICEILDLPKNAGENGMAC